MNVCETVHMADYEPTPEDRRWGVFSGTYSMAKIGTARRRFPFYWRRGPAMYAVAMDKLSPLTFTDAQGNQWKTSATMGTDMASIPYMAQWWIPKDAFLESALFHDDAWARGGLWFKPAGVPGPFVWRALTKYEANQLLRVMARAQGIGAFSAAMVLSGVHTGAAFSRK